MNARIRTYLVVFLLFFGYKSIAQENVLGNVNMTNSIDHIELNMGNLKSTTLTTVDLTSKALVGSMYINESFMPGTISSQENTLHSCAEGTQKRPLPSFHNQKLLFSKYAGTVKAKRVSLSLVGSIHNTPW